MCRAGRGGITDETREFETAGDFSECWRALRESHRIEIQDIFPSLCVVLIYDFSYAVMPVSDSIQPDVFDSDNRFLAVVSALLLIGGVVALLVSLICKVMGLGYCLLDWIPMMGGYDIFRRDLAAINIPLAMIILSIGLRLFTGFGWTTCMILLLLGTGVFSGLAYWLGTQQLGAYLALIEANQIFAGDYPVMESFAIDALLAILCLGMAVFLMQGKIRRLYWHKDKPAA